MINPVRDHSYFRGAFPPSSTFQRNGGVQVRWGESVAAADSLKSLQQEYGSLHRDPSSSGDRLEKLSHCPWLQGRRGRTWQSISPCLLTLSPPPFSLLSCHLYYSNPIQLSSTFSSYRPSQHLYQSFRPLFVFISYFISFFVIFNNQQCCHWEKEWSLFRFICMPG